MRSVEQRLRAIPGASAADLLAALSDASPLVVAAAASRIQDPNTGPELLHAYLRLEAGAPKSDPGCRGRLAVLSALARLDARESEAAAGRAIRTIQVEQPGDTAVTLRAAAAGVLAAVGAASALVEIGILLFDVEPNAPCSVSERPYAKARARAAAAQALGALGEPGGGALLAVKLALPGAEVADVLSECMDALVALREPKALDLLQPYLTHADPYLAATAATDMAAAGREQAIPTIEEALDRAVPDARASLVYAIGSIRAEAAQAALSRLREHTDPRVQGAARELTGG